MNIKKASLWFEVLEELGERPNMSFASFDVTTKEVLWRELSHKDHDGLGGIFELARSFDIKDTQIDYKLSDRRPPTILEKIKALIKYHPESKLRHTNWINFKRKKNGSPFRMIMSFNKEEIEKIKILCKRNRCSSHIFFFHKVDRYISKELLVPEEERWWMVPVNMRTKETKYNRNNFSSYISTQIRDNLTPRELNKQMIEKLKGYLHYAPWFYMKIIAFLGKKNL